MHFVDSSNGQDGHRRPAWLPHPGLLVAIAVLWVVAGAIGVLSPLTR